MLSRNSYLDSLDFEYIIMDEPLTPDKETVEIDDGFPLPCLCKTCSRTNKCSSREK